ncbi:flagellar hook-basal body complex protein FliE [Pseudoprimorskyibacter insulae]|uniref:Flagellar hook-basal body complex protein FliE n=1 Tax=Pseudoprimorskyibacter insulae TaxID=1695997 RepID=A0A2R8AYU9_9RHOB|nr:flagellar hook-basal body complex protein FliE [Pseudoprimorskyibacter insulae]SPF81213.1 Flagellar hook-basal body complex protein FliE [Pseudoprimorskyibacter insulae]
MDVRSLFAAQKYSATKPATQAEPIVQSPAAEVARSFEQTLQSAEALSQSAMVQDADPHALVQALAQSELAVETVVTVRNKVVEAYNEILRMPV